MTLRVIQKDYIAFESLHLPLSDDGERVNMLFGRSRYIAGERNKEHDREDAAARRQMG